MDFAEGFLQREEFLFPRRAQLRIRIHHVALFHVDVVVVVNAKHAQRTIDWLKGGLAFEKIETDGEIVRIKDLVAAPEKFRTVRALCADAAGRWQLARFKLKEILGGDVEEDVLAINRRIAFEFALQIGMPEL